MPRRRCQLADFVLDQLDFILEQLERAQSDPDHRVSAVHAAQCAIPFMYQRLKEENEPLFCTFLLVGSGSWFDRSDWWESLLTAEPEEFGDKRREFSQHVEVLKSHLNK